MSSKIKVALVGIGSVAVKNYLPYLSSREDVELLLYSRTANKARQAAETFKARAFENVESLLAEKPDTVMILTMEDQRAAVAAQILPLKPKRVFFEKPLTAENGQANMNENDFLVGRKIIETARQNGTQTAMMFNYRYFTQSQKAKEIIRQRSFGKLRQVQALVHYACWSHAIDLIHSFAGPVKTITALGGTETYEHNVIRGTDKTAAFITEAGATGSIIGTVGLDFAMPLYDLDLRFEGGRIHLRCLDDAMEVMDHRSGQIETYAPHRNGSRWNHYDASFVHALADYLDSLKNDCEAPVTGMDGLRELQFEAAMIRSIRTGSSVDLNESFPLSTSPSTAGKIPAKT